MRKLLVTLLMITSQIGVGQKFGFKAGMDISRELIEIDGITIISKPIAGANYGMYSNFKIGRSVVFSPEISFNLYGGKFISGDTVSVDKLSYLSLPLVLKVKASDYLYIQAGFQIEKNVKTESADNNPHSPDGSFDGLILDGNNSVLFGIEYNFQSLDLGIRYHLGMSNILRPKINAELRLNSFQFYIGIRTVLWGKSTYDN